MQEKDAARRSAARHPKEPAVDPPWWLAIAPWLLALGLLALAMRPAG